MPCELHRNANECPNEVAFLLVIPAGSPPASCGDKLWPETQARVFLRVVLDPDWKPARMTTW